jgi:hypothetical protein
MSLPADYTFDPTTDQGSHTLPNVALDTVGTQAFRIRDTAHATLTDLVSGIVVTNGAPVALVIKGLNNPVSAGVSQTFDVEALDAYGNLVTGANGAPSYTGQVQISSTDPPTSATDFTMTAGDAASYR